jgi:hypothetical protein
MCSFSIKFQSSQDIVLLTEILEIHILHKQSKGRLFKESDEVNQRAKNVSHLIAVCAIKNISYPRYKRRVMQKGVVRTMISCHQHVVRGIADHDPTVLELCRGIDLIVCIFASVFGGLLGLPELH